MMTESYGDFVEDGSFLVLQNNVDGEEDSLQSSSPPNYNALSMDKASDDVGETSGNHNKEDKTELRNDLKGPVSNSGSVGMFQQSNNNDVGTSYCSSVSTNSEEGMSSLISQLNLMKEEKEKYKAELSSNNKKLKNFVENYKTIEQEMLRLRDEHKMKNEESRRVVSELRQTIAELTQKLATEKDRTVRAEAELENLKSNNEMLNNAVLEKDATLDSYWKQMEELHQKIERDQNELKSLRATLRSQSHISNSEIMKQFEEREQIQEQQQKDFERKLREKNKEIEDYQSQICKFNEHRVKKDKEISNLKDELDELMLNMEKLKLAIQVKDEQIATLAAKQGDDSSSSSFSSLESLRHNLNKAETENIQLKTMIEAYSAQDKDFAAWQEQLKTYQHDFNMERNAKERLADERDALLRELNSVRELLANRRPAAPVAAVSRNEASGPTSPVNSAPNSGHNSLTSTAGGMFNFFKKEVLGFGWEDEGAPSGATGGTSEAQASAKTPKGGKCPICVKYFSSIKDLEEHASICGTSECPSDPFVFP